MAKAGCTRVYLGGSLVTAKELPGDWDGCFETADVDFFSLEKAIARSDHFQMNTFFFGEIYRANDLTITGEPFIRFFQQGRDLVARRIVALDPATAR